MKNLKINVCFAAILLAALTTGCVNGDDYSAPTEECTTLTPTKEVTDITSAATAAYSQYTEEDIIEAYVTSSDEGGNFYKSVSFVATDGSIGFSIPMDAYNIYTKFEPGRKVYVNLKDRYFVKENGSTVIGSLYNNNTPEDLTDDEVGRISGVEYQNVGKRSCEKVNEDDLVNHITISEANNDSYLNKLIEFDDVQFTDASLGKRYFDASLNPVPTWTATNHYIVDADGNTIIVRNSQYATFANNLIPSGNGKIRGVLTKYCNSSGSCDYQFMIRTINDVMLDNPRVNPTIENFESYATNTATFPNYYNLKVVGTNDWYVGSFNQNKYLQARKGSNSGATKIFFVMPYDFDAYTKVSFQTLYGYMSQTTTPIMKVYYSTNFDQNNPTANLIEITSSFIFSNHTGTGWASSFTNSGTHTFTGMSGQGHIIFAYDVASTSNTTAESRPAIELDNIKFQ